MGEGCRVVRVSSEGFGRRRGFALELTLLGFFASVASGEYLTSIENTSIQVSSGCSPLEWGGPQKSAKLAGGSWRGLGAWGGTNGVTTPLTGSQSAEGGRRTSKSLVEV